MNSLISRIPNDAAVYRFLGGRTRHSYVAYVGVARNLRHRITQHLVNQDSKLATGMAAVSLDSAIRQSTDVGNSDLLVAPNSLT